MSSNINLTAAQAAEAQRTGILLWKGGSASDSSAGTPLSPVPGTQITATVTKVLPVCGNWYALVLDLDGTP